VGPSVGSVRGRGGSGGKEPVQKVTPVQVHGLPKLSLVQGILEPDGVAPQPVPCHGQLASSPAHDQGITELPSDLVDEGPKGTPCPVQVRLGPEVREERLPPMEIPGPSQSEVGQEAEAFRAPEEGVGRPPFPSAQIHGAQSVQLHHRPPVVQAASGPKEALDRI
jgi:hypothetical protein